MADGQSPQELLNSQQFLSDWTKLPPEERRKAISKIVPEFSGIPQEEQDKFMSSLQDHYTHISNIQTNVHSTAARVGMELGHDIASAAKGMMIQNIDNPMLSGPMSGYTARESAEASGVDPSKMPPPFDPVEMVAGPTRELFGVKAPGESVVTEPGEGLHPANFVASLLGGDPARRRDLEAQGNYAGGLTAQYGVPLLTLGLGRIFAGKMRETATPTRRGVNSLETLQGGRGIMSGDPALDAIRQGELQKTLQQAAMEEGITDKTVNEHFAARDKAGTQSDIVGRVRRGNSMTLRLFNRAVDISHRPLDKVLDLYGKSPSGGVSLKVAKSLRDQAAEIGDVNTPLRNAINTLADKIEGKRTFNDLNDVKSHANKMADSLYSPNPGKEIAGTAETAYAYRLAANAIRQEMYPILQQLSGGSVDLSAMGRREADAITARDATYDTYYKQVAPKAASHGASSFLGYVFGRTDAPSHSLGSRHVAARVAEKIGLAPPPGGQFNMRMREGLGRMGEGTSPERVGVTGPSVTAGKSPGDLMAQNLHQNKIPHSHEFTEAEFRKQFGISPRTPMRSLVAGGLAEATPGGKFKVGHRVTSRFGVRVEPFKPGTRSKPHARAKALTAAGTASSAIATPAKMTPPPPNTAENEEEEPPQE